MTEGFRKKSREALANPFLQEALDRNAESREAARIEALRSLRDPDLSRQQARAIRQETVAHLDQYLRQFTERLLANGFRVHHAEEAQDAVRIAVEIARSASASTVVKAKSMLSEEIELNHGMEQAGIRPIETDLGEFIVQLRSERPAHIITPAVHLRREDVAESFSAKLGTEMTTDVGELTRAARAELRGAFLTSPVGISGVNFGVADSGSLCLVTNEGNGRMVTTLPAVHIAIMGIERIVPSFADLDRMLKLLPRSATGQRQTSYVSLIQGPRREGETEGPRERHVILVDNGRRRLADSNLAESLLCIRCGACLNACPVYREVGGHTYDSVYGGPIGSVVSPGLFGVGHFGHLAKASSLCGACMDACPVYINFPELLLRVRDKYAKEVRQPAPVSLGARMYTWIMLSSGRYRAARWLAHLLQRLLPQHDGWIRRLPPPFGGWSQTRHFPRFAARPLRDRLPASQPRRPDAPRPRQPASPPPVPVEVEAQSQDANSERIALFQQALEAVGGTFHLCPAGEAPQRVAECLAEFGADSLLTPDHGDKLLEAITEKLDREGVALVEAGGDSTEADRLARLERLGNAAAGITGALAGLASTGSLLISTAQAGTHLASLLPPVHIAILRAADIQPSFETWLLTGGRRAIREASNLVLVTGPSRTADIELTLTVGVHGPGKLVVFCVT